MDDNIIETPSNGIGKFIMDNLLYYKFYIIAIIIIIIIYILYMIINKLFITKSKSNTEINIVNELHENYDYDENENENDDNIDIVYNENINIREQNLTNSEKNNIVMKINNSIPNTDSNSDIENNTDDDDDDNQDK